MNIQKDLLRLTLVISIMAAVLTLLSNEIFLPRNSVKVEITEMWRNKSFQEKLKGVDDLLENNREFHNLSKIEQLNIKRRIKESVPSVEEELKSEREKNLSSVTYVFCAGWRELTLLGFGGFAFVWLIYLFVRWIIIGFIVSGFKGKPLKGG
jgi:hypothetical protein